MFICTKGFEALYMQLSSSPAAQCTRVSCFLPGDQHLRMKGVFRKRNEELAGRGVEEGRPQAASGDTLRAIPGFHLALQRPAAAKGPRSGWPSSHGTAKPRAK